MVVSSVRQATYSFSLSWTVGFSENRSDQTKKKYLTVKSVNEKIKIITSSSVGRKILATCGARRENTTEAAEEKSIDGAGGRDNSWLGLPATISSSVFILRRENEIEQKVAS